MSKKSDNSWPYKNINLSTLSVIPYVGLIIMFLSTTLVHVDVIMSIQVKQNLLSFTE